MQATQLTDTLLRTQQEHVSFNFTNSAQCSIYWVCEKNELDLRILCKELAKHLIPNVSLYKVSLPENNFTLMLWHFNIYNDKQ